MEAYAEDVDIMGFREYDEAVAKLLTVTIHPDRDDRSISITVVPNLSGMQKEFASQDKMNPARPKQKQIKDDKTVSYPASALTRLGWEFDISRWTKVGYSNLRITEEGNRILQSKHPMPYEVQYQLDIVTKMRSTMNMIVRAIAVKFIDREVWVPVYTGKAFGTKIIPVKLAFGGPQELTNWEHDENQDTIFRMAFTFNVELWLFPDVTSVPTVKTIAFVSDGVTVSKTTEADTIAASKRVERTRFPENT